MFRRLTHEVQKKQMDFTIDKPVIVINGFQKKSHKTPRREIILAQRIKKLYFDEKE